MKYKVGDRVKVGPTYWSANFASGAFPMGTIVEVLFINHHSIYPYEACIVNNTAMTESFKEDELVENGIQHLKRRHNL